MSFTGVKDKIEYGDTVLLYIGYDNMLPIVIKQGQTHQTKFGAVKHSSLVGKQFGTRIQCPKGWIYVLHPTPELWTLSLPHRTQILYSTDISMIIFNLDLKPGSVVAEAGTGSGSLSHAILRTIQPSGHLYTFEFHQERSEKAREEFAQHGLSEFVTVTHRDVCGDGFQLDHKVDAVFLDLPKPWECIASAKQSIKEEGGRICTFSPCIEQVQRSCEELSSHGFSDIATLECLARNFNIQYAKLQNVPFSQTPANTSSTSEGTEKRNAHDQSAESDASAAKQSRKDFANPVSKADKAKDKKNKLDANSYAFPSAVPALAMQGHTGFLTFATLYCH